MGNNKMAVRLAVTFGVIALAAAVYIMRPAASTATPEAPLASITESAVDAQLPRLLDLGADKCIPCKMMAPILETLKTEYVSEFKVEFIDVWKHPDLAKPYGLKVIPTQIFFGDDGTELFRHEGFYSREDILAKWSELGIELTAKGE